MIPARSGAKDTRIKHTCIKAFEQEGPELGCAGGPGGPNRPACQPNVCRLPLSKTACNNRIKRQGASGFFGLFLFQHAGNNFDGTGQFFDGLLNILALIFQNSDLFIEPGQSDPQLGDLAVAQVI